MTGSFANRLFRIAFVLAGCYNLAFGLWAGFWPMAFFELFKLAPPRYPGIWACLGMVVGVYGFLYLHAAWKLESAWPIIAVGLLGKALGPIGMVMSFGDDWPRRVGMICIYNDLIWWLPFGLFLLRGTTIGRWIVRIAPWICISVHSIASLAVLILLRHGTITESNTTLRAMYIAGNETRWSIGWFLWMLSAMSYVGFCAWWGSYLAVGQVMPDRSGGRSGGHPVHVDLGVVSMLAVIIAAIGTLFDFSGEGSMILILVERAESVLPVIGNPFDISNAAAFMSIERNFMLLSAGAANLCYTLAGIILTLATSDLPRWVRGSMWMTWVAGISMTVAAIFDSPLGILASSIVLFPLLLLWTAWMGARWRGP